MAIDIIGYINTQEPVKSWTPAEKQAMLDDLCATHGYNEKIIDENGEEVDNPESKKDFANRMIVEQIKRWVNGWRKTQAEKNITIDEIELN